MTEEITSGATAPKEPEAAEQGEASKKAPPDKWQGFKHEVELSNDADDPRGFDLIREYQTGDEDRERIRANDHGVWAVCAYLDRQGIPITGQTVAEVIGCSSGSALGLLRTLAERYGHLCRVQYRDGLRYYINNAEERARVAVALAQRERRSATDLVQERDERIREQEGQIDDLQRQLTEQGEQIAKLMELVGQREPVTA